MTTMNPLKAFEHELLIRRVASRYVGASNNVAPTAKVTGHAEVLDNAKVSGNAQVTDNAVVSGTA